MSFIRTYKGDGWSLSEDGETLLTVTETQENGKTLVALSGVLRSDMEHTFADELIALMTVGKDVWLDCKNLKYIANSCQDALLSVQQTADSINRGRLTLTKVPEDIYADFQRTNLHELLRIK